MTADDRVDDLLDRWQAAFDAGRDVPPAELCRDCPELAAEVGRRADLLRRAARLAAPPADDPRTTPQADTPDTPALGRQPAAADPPAEVGGYRPVRLLGEGGMGRVWEAADPALSRRVAVKVMRPELAADPAARGRFLREARAAAAAVHHDHVVPVYHVGDGPAGPYLVMPLLAGESLDARLKRDPAVPPAEAARVAAEAAAGLAAAHAKGLIHRDVKPANLWLDAGTGRVRVLDFGLARAADRTDGLTATGAVVGTPGYMAPEQAADGEVDARSDLFSLGCVLYRMLAGRPAFDGKSAMSVLLATSQHDPPPPDAVRPGVPAGLSALTMRLLAKEPAARPASASAVADELRRLGSDPTATYHPPPQPAARRRTWRRAVPAGVAAVGLVVAAVVALRPNPPTPGPDPTATVGPPPPAVPPAVVREEPLRVVSLDVEHFATRPDGVVRVGVLGRESFAAALGDRVRVTARLSRPGYTYIVACQAAGGVELCFPEDESEPPPRSAEPAYPWRDRNEFYGLREGSGLWCFAVVASTDPLPAWREWAGRAVPWKPGPAAAGVAWADVGRGPEPVASGGVNRGKGETLPGGDAVGRVAGWLRGRGSAAAVGFVVGRS